jgi:hypothetical protein
MIKQIIITPVNNQTGVTVTLEGASIILTILVSASMLIGVGIKVISKFNAITADIRDLREDLNTHINAEGHEKILQQVRILQKEAAIFDKLFAVHQANYLNRTETVNMLISQLDQKINLRWERSEEEISKIISEVKELQKYLQRQGDFKIRGN